MPKHTQTTTKSGDLAGGLPLRDSWGRNPLLVSVSATIVVSSPGWKLENQRGEFRKLLVKLAAGGCLTEFKLAIAGSASALDHQGGCPVCGWVHDRGFRQIKPGSGKTILLGGRLPEIVKLVHVAHEKGFPGLSTKDDELLKVCGGYGNPCKAFDDLKHRNDYKALFDTRKRGFISLRGAGGTNRNKSEAGPE